MAILPELPKPPFEPSPGVMAAPELVDADAVDDSEDVGIVVNSDVTVVTNVLVDPWLVDSIVVLLGVEDELDVVVLDVVDVAGVELVEPGVDVVGSVVGVLDVTGGVVSGVDAVVGLGSAEELGGTEVVGDAGGEPVGDIVLELFDIMKVVNFNRGKRLVAAAMLAIWPKTKHYTQNCMTHDWGRRLGGGQLLGREPQGATIEVKASSAIQGKQ